jgi:phage replication O-like protein O
MASPQKDNGFTPVAHEILEQAAKINLNGTQFRILLIVWRYTYGFGRKAHKFSLSFLAEALSTHKNQIQRELQNLIERNILTVISGGLRQSRTLSFNKDYELWDSKSDNGLAVSLEEPEIVPKQLISGQFDANLTANPLTKIDISLKIKDLNNIYEMEDIESMEKQKIQFHDTVFLTQAEYDRLCNDFGKETTDLFIESLDEWQTNNPKKQKVDHNKTIRVWIRKDAAKKKPLYPSNQQQKNEQQMDVLAKFYKEGAAREANGDSQTIGGYQNSVPELPGY